MDYEIGSGQGVTLHLPQQTLKHAGLPAEACGQTAALQLPEHASPGAGSECRPHQRQRGAHTVGHGLRKLSSGREL